ncbi:MAG: purine-nucleoside phosphorylase [Deltaproteobacteria bacterium]|jgi:purine-nucleoside phosphorylase|nr:purine-nucleoside phosphorylase [Deltaproteobacteria bacterium]MBW2535521.1 purine-nucleoside phosphorylase [Deltaproteobacteria bacterium]
MTVHLGEGTQFADTVLLPGDPLRAKAIAERLDDVECVHQVRGMPGYTGTRHGVRISTQGTGMGMPSASIYVHELITVCGVRRLIRVGTCGAIQEDLRLGDVVLAMAASTDSNMNRRRLDGLDYAPCASFRLLRAAVEAAEARNLPVRVGGVYSADAFYDETDAWKRLAPYGILVAEMETSALYTTAARHGAEALSVLTVSDRIATGEALTPEQRERSCTDMMELAIDVAVRCAS